MLFSTPNRIPRAHMLRYVLKHARSRRVPSFSAVQFVFLFTCRNFFTSCGWMVAKKSLGVFEGIWENNWNWHDLLRVWPSAWKINIRIKWSSFLHASTCDRLLTSFFLSNYLYHFLTISTTMKNGHGENACCVSGLLYLGCGVGLVNGTAIKDRCLIFRVTNLLMNNSKCNGLQLRCQFTRRSHILPFVNNTFVDRYNCPRLAL